MHLIVKAPLRLNHDHVLKARLRLTARIDLFLKGYAQGFNKYSLRVLVVSTRDNVYNG